MAAHPYRTLPDSAFWRRSMTGNPAQDIDPVLRAKFVIRPEHSIATAGSCFAQHIARRLVASGFRYLVTEDVHPLFAPFAANFNYGTFTARFGNIYTARQFLQLLQRAYGEFIPVDDVWTEDGGWVKDPFRPEIQPGGFASREECHADRQQHLAAVRCMVETMDVMVFTLGLTEAWRHRADGAVYPLCPGVAGGEFDPAIHEFVNFSVDDVTTDLDQAFNFIRRRNPRVRFVLTVSPVPLIATMEDRSVLVSTTYSKSVLRVAAENIARATDVAYFPSYEIITGNFNRGGYFASDLRSITEDGVDHVMRLFLKHYTEGEAALTATSSGKQESDDHIAFMRRAAAVICDEEKLDNG